MLGDTSAMYPSRLDMAGDVFRRDYSQARIAHPLLVIAKAIQACTQHRLSNSRYQLLFIFEKRSIPAEPCTNREHSSGLQHRGTAFEEPFLVLKVFAAFHYPDQVDGLRFGLPLICVADLELNVIAQTSDLSGSGVAQNIETNGSFS